MSGRRHNGKLRKLRDRGQAKTKTRVLVAHDLDDAMMRAGVIPAKRRARYYRFGGDVLVTWQAGRFTLRVVDPQHLKGFAACPKGLARRVSESIRKGITHG